MEATTTLFESTRAAHILLGFLALVGFWGAALAAKGSKRHRRYGRFYLVVMTGLLAVTLMMAVGMVISDQGKRATFNVYITLVSVSSVWMAWRSIADRDDVDRYRGWACKLLCILLAGYALFLLAFIVPKVPTLPVKIMVVAFSTLGLATCASLLNRILRGADHPRWWLSDHLTAMALNFGATHASMTILGLGSIMPSVKAPEIRTSILVGWMLAALLVRVWAGRRFLGQAGKPAVVVIA